MCDVWSCGVILFAAASMTGHPTRFARGSCYVLRPLHGRLKFTGHGLWVLALRGEVGATFRRTVNGGLVLSPCPENLLDCSHLEDSNTLALYKKIVAAKYKAASFITVSVKDLADAPGLCKLRVGYLNNQAGGHHWSHQRKRKSRSLSQGS